MALEDYRKKRDFTDTPEPEGGQGEQPGNRFVIHEHHATRLHFDLRLEIDGVLKSWAVPKGPSMDPADKRLAMMVEDHPLDYIAFRGEIAEGNYGAGFVEIWDSGIYVLEENALENGKLVVDLAGTKLRGAFHMVRLKDSKDEWLLMKSRDEFAQRGWKLEQIIPGGSRKDVLENHLQEVRSPTPAKDSDPMPEHFSPMLCTQVDKPFTDRDWIFEPKYDGYRAIAYIGENSFKFLSRTNNDLIAKFPQANAIAGAVDASTAIIDGEIVALDENGRPNFQMLQNAMRSLNHNHKLVYYAFDLLYLNGKDLRQRTLGERKDMLRQIIKPSNFLIYSDHIQEMGELLFNEAAKAGYEGIIAKKLDSTYTSKRSTSWLKIKNLQNQEFVIGGYTEPRGARGYFGALLVGVQEEQGLRFAGHIGTGFDDATLKELYELMSPLQTEHSPFIKTPKTNEPAHWIKPELVCQAKFTEWTDEGVLRQPVYLGLRVDKQPDQVHEEKAMPAEKIVAPPKNKSASAKKKAVPAEELFQQKQLRGDQAVLVDEIEVNLTSLDKKYWPEEGITKGDLLRYYYDISETIIPHLTGRPIILKRYHDGIHGDSFYQHNLKDAPEYVTLAPIDEDGDGEVINYGVIDNVASLLYIVNLGCIAQNPFSSRAQSLNKPDWVDIDLDPEEASFDTVCEVAMEVKRILDELGIRGYAKTSGSRGMHIYIPVENIYTQEQVREFGRAVATLTAARLPEIATIKRLKKDRTPEQIYVDFIQNGAGKSLAGVYSVRAVPGATVSTPLTWEEVRSKPDRSQYTMQVVRQRISEFGDLFGGVLTDKQQLLPALEKLEEIIDSDKKKGR